MFDYMSAGIPIITTRFGTRGIGNKDVFVLAEVDEMESAITKFDAKEAEDKVLAARRYVEDVFDWKVAVQPMLSILRTLL